MDIVVQDANRDGPLAEEQLQAFEQELGVELPREYRDFLKAYHGGVPQPNQFWIFRGTWRSQIEQLYGLEDGPASLRTWRLNREANIPEDLLAIGQDEKGNFICIGLSGADRGVLYFLDHELRPRVDPEPREGIVRLSDSFDEFLGILEALP